MFRRNYIIYLVILIFTFAARELWCQKESKITGKIADAITGESLIGADVMLEGTGMGAASDMNGYFLISNIPGGLYTLRVSYLGYKTISIKIHLKEGEHLQQNFKLHAVGVSEKEIVVTAQASGQNAAINQQLASNKIVNVVSAARIQELPDANAAESVGRLPGVYLLRSGGEGYAVSIRGLAPDYNMIMIDGVEMPSTSSGGRAVDMSMISSNMLNSIEVYKTVTPDMDAAVLGGVVNFGIREARRTSSGAPELELSSQGGYNGLQSTFGDYKFSATAGDRFLNNRLGILAQAVIEKINLTSDNLGASYDLLTFNYGKTNPMELTSLTPTYYPRNRKRYDISLSMDYKLPAGKIDLMNFFSSGDTKTDTRSQSYGLSSNAITYGAGYTPNKLNVITNLLDFKQELFTFHTDIRLSHSYTENINTGSWHADFTQYLDLSKIPVGEDPRLIAQAALAKVDLDNMYLGAIGTSNSFSKHRNITGSIDVKKVFNLSDFISATLKFGGMYKYSYLNYDYNDSYGTLYPANAITIRKQLLEVFPWMTKSPYNTDPTGNQPLPITLFTDPAFSYGKFLSGDYTMGMPVNLNLVSQMINIVADSMRGVPVGGSSVVTFAPDVYGSGANDYSGNEYESAGYIMATLNVGPLVTIIPGVRYQGLRTSYKAPRYYNAGGPDPYPLPLPHRDTTISEYHGYWLPDLSVNIRPFTWLNIRAAYTNTITYPDPADLTPVIDVIVTQTEQSVNWHNYALKPGRSQNYDLALSFFDNGIGLFTADGFLKQIDDLIFATGKTVITDPSLYPGLPARTKSYDIYTSINNPNRVNLWGIELEWQTHFWYLPGFLSGFVTSINYTHIFSGAKYPTTVTYPGVYPTYIPRYVDTTYSDRLIDQPNDVVNLSVGYDYKTFSVVASMIYQANVFNSANFWPELRSDKAKYLRWDLVVKQGLPWFGLAAYLNLNNINSESDVYVESGNGFPTGEQSYGLTANLGLRWELK